MDSTAQIFAYGKKKYRYIFYGSIVKFIILFLLMWISVALADSVFYFSEVTRWGLFLINIPFVVFLFWKLIYQPFKKWSTLEINSDLSEMAVEIGNYNESVRDRLVNVYQLSKMRQTVLTKAAVRQVWKSIKNKTFSEKIVLKDFLPETKQIIPVFIGTILLLFFLWPEISNSTLRLLNPSNEYLKVPYYSFKINPGNKDILINNPLEIQAEFIGPQISGLNLLLYQQDEVKRTLPLEKNKGIYFLRLKEVNSSFRFLISATPLLEKGLKGKLVSDLYSVNVMTPPKVQEVSIKINQPNYTRNESIFNEKNNGNILALKGALVELKITANKAVKSAKLQFQSALPLQLQNRGKVISGNFKVRNNGSYKIILEDVDGLINQNPIEYTITVLPDNPPFVDIVEPGEDIEAQLDDILAIKINAADDYGLKNLKVRYRYIKQSENADSSWHTLSEKSFNNIKRAEHIEYMDFSKFYVGYNDVLEYLAVASDNNAVEGFSKSTSPIYRVTFPSLDELFNEFTQQEEEKVEDLQKLTKESEDLKDTLEEIRREIKRTNKMDWDLKKQIQNSLEQQKKAQEEIEKIQNDLEEMVNKLDQNSLLNQEILDKYNKLQELFRDIASPELLESMRKLQEAAEKSNPNDIKKALDSFKQNQEAFQANLERTLELFKQVQLEQQLDQLLKQAENLTKNQEKISENLAQNENDMAAKQSKQQGEQLNSLQKNIDKLAQKEQLDNFQKTKDQLEAIDSKISNEKLMERVKQLQQQIKENQKNQSQSNSENLKQSFKEIQSNISEALENMQQQNKQNVQKKMLSTAKKMLKLSYDQEKVQRKTKSASQLNDDLKELGREQSYIKENLRKIISDVIDLSKETFFVDPKMNKSLANAYNNMQQSMDALSERQNGPASTKQQQAMQSLNIGISSLQQSMQQLSDSKSGTGFEQFMEKLEQMAGAQGGLNDETMSFMEGQGNKGQMGLQQQAESGRLAAQQKAIRDALKEMADQAGNRSDILGRLNEMGEQMEEIVQDMLANNVDRETIDRQRQILSRMLDAQKSVREREYSKKRKAEQGKKYLAKDPGKIKDFEDISQKELQEALKRALSEGYHNDYQKLINAYFKKLSSKINEKK